MNPSLSPLKQVFRRLVKSPVFTGLTLLTLAIGIGANTAIFSVVNGVLLKPLAFPDAANLVSVRLSALGVGLKDIPQSPATYFTIREEARAFEDIGIWAPRSVNITGIGDPERVPVVVMTDGVLPTLGVRPVLGHWFTREEDAPRAPQKALLSWGYWQRRFGGEASVIGRNIVVDARPCEIVGVMPRDFRFLDTDAAMFVPLQLDRATAFVGNFSWDAVARLKPGISLASANTDVARVLPLTLSKFPPAPGMSARVFADSRMAPRVIPLKDDVVGDTGKVLWVLMGSVGLVLFIASANVANLLLVRAEGRQHELAIRAALGAGRRRIAADLLTESVTLALLGGTLGALLADSAVRALVAYGPANLPRLHDLTIDFPVLLFAFAVSLVCGLLFGLVPVWKYAGPRLAGSLRDGGRGASEGRERHRARSVLVAAQVALALVLLVGSGLMIRTFVAMRHVSPGFTRPEEILTLRISIPEAQVSSALDAIRMEAEIKRRIEALPQVASAALTNSVTMDGNIDNDPIFVEGRVYGEGELPTLRRYKSVSPDYLKTMGNPILAGRDLTWTDIFEARKVVLVSDNLARELWGSPAAALGKRVRENPKGVWREIVGVTGNDRDDGVDQPAPKVVYWPLYRTNFWSLPEVGERYVAFAIRSPRTGTPSFLREVSEVIWSVNPDLPISNPRSMRTIYDRSMARTSFTLTIVGIAGSMALLLGLIGIYGVLSYSVSQRTREIGIRIALGAPETNVRRMFLGYGFRLALVGTICGLAAAAALTRLMKALLFEVSPLDPVTYFGVPLILIAAALLAAYVPARRATNVSPVEALRIE